MFLYSHKRRERGSSVFLWGEKGLLYSNGGKGEGIFYILMGEGRGDLLYSNGGKGEGVFYIPMGEGASIYL